MSESSKKLFGMEKTMDYSPWFLAILVVLRKRCFLIKVHTRNRIASIIFRNSQKQKSCSHVCLKYAFDSKPYYMLELKQVTRTPLK